MKVIDQLPERSLRVVKEDNGEFSVEQQTTTESPSKVLLGHLPKAVAMSYWHKLLLANFYNVTHSISTAHALADQRMATIP